MALLCCPLPGHCSEPRAPCIKARFDGHKQCSLFLDFQARHTLTRGQDSLPFSAALLKSTLRSTRWGMKVSCVTLKTAELCTLWKPKDRSPPLPSRPEVGHPGNSGHWDARPSDPHPWVGGWLQCQQ